MTYFKLKLEILKAQTDWASRALPCGPLPGLCPGPTVGAYSAP